MVAWEALPINVLSFAGTEQTPARKLSTKIDMLVFKKANKKNSKHPDEAMPIDTLPADALLLNPEWL